MKNFRKLFVAAIMLVVALTAVVSSTYAWFTLQNEADVKTIDLEVGTAGNDLQISKTGVDGTWGYAVTLANIIGGKLTPVTYDEIEEDFVQLTLDESTNSRFEYEAATPFSPGVTAPAGSAYLTYDLHFRSSEAATLYLDVDNSLFAAKDELETSDLAVLGAIRVMITDVANSTNYIWEPFTTLVAGKNSGSFGNGDYFDPAKAWIALDAFQGGDDGDILKLDGVYKLMDGTGEFFAGRIYTPKTPALITPTTGKPAYNAISLGSLTATLSKQYTITIWLEGWDGDANNNAALSTFTSRLLFKAE